MSAVFRALAVSLALAVAASPAAAGQQAYTPPEIAVTPPPGWSLTPSMGVSRTWDDNVTLKEPGDNPVSDVINVVNPRADLNFTSSHGQLAAHYDGAFLLYRSSTTLNSYEQHGSLAAKRRLSSRTALFIDGSAAVAPTTQLLQLTAVPYVRAGSRTEDARVGVESVLSKRLSIVADVHAQEVHFDANAPFANLLQGGTSVGAGLLLRERLSEQTALTGDYDGLRASVGANHDNFFVQNTTVGLERQLTPRTTIAGAVGVARLDAPAFGPAQMGPIYRFGIARDLRASVVEVLLSRLFVPSWSSGGTTRNDEATVKLRLPLSRRLYTLSLVSWRQANPLVEVARPLRTVWIQATVGYTARSWVRIEGYYLGTKQTAVLVPDELLAHNQIGFQVIASKPVRLR
jgi:hypothetical protein